MRLSCRFNWHDWQPWQWIPTAQVSSNIIQYSAAQSSACRSCGLIKLNHPSRDPYILVGQFETHGVELLLDALALWRDRSGGGNSDADVKLREAIKAYETTLGKPLVVPTGESNG